MAISNEAKIKVTIEGIEKIVSQAKRMGTGFSSAFTRANQAANTLKKKFTDVGAVMKAAAAAFVVKDLIDASNTQEQAVAAFEQTLRSMGRYTQEFSGQLQGLASQIQNEGIIGDETLLRGAKFLATYKDITNDLMPDTMRVMADFAALTGGDVASAANILGKASMGMTGQMARYGITLSDTAKKSKDFKLILAEIKEQVGGQNKALSETSAGALKQFSNAWGDLKELGGDLLKMFIVPFTKLVRPFIEALTGMDKGLGMMIGTMGLAALTVFKVVIPAMKAFGVVSKSAFGWVGAIIAVVELLYIAWETNFLGIRDAVDVVWRYMKGFWEFIKDFGARVGNFYKALGEIIWGALTFDKEAILKAWDDLKSSLVDGWGVTMEKVAGATKKATDAPAGAAKKAIVQNFADLGTDAGKAQTEAFLKEVKEMKAAKMFTESGLQQASTKKKSNQLESFRGGGDLAADLPAKLQGVEQTNLESSRRVATIWDKLYSQELPTFVGQFGTGLEGIFQRVVTNGQDSIKSFRDVFRAMEDVLRQSLARMAAQIAARAAMFGALNLLFPGSGAVAGGFGNFVFSKLGFADGGYTGNVAPDSVAGVVHGQEFVINSQATKIFRPVLEYMNSPQALRGGGAQQQSALNDKRIVSELQGIKKALGSMGAPGAGVNVSIGNEKIYSNVVKSRERELLRRGKNTNRESFL